MRKFAKSPKFINNSNILPNSAISNSNKIKINSDIKHTLLENCAHYDVRYSCNLIFNQRELFLNNHKSYLMGLYDNDLTSIDIFNLFAEKKNISSVLLGDTNKTTHDMYKGLYNYVCLMKDENNLNKNLIYEYKKENLLAYNDYKNFFDKIIDSSTDYFVDILEGQDVVVNPNILNKSKDINLDLSIAFWSLKNNSKKQIKLFNANADNLLLLEDICLNYSLYNLKDLLTLTLSNYKRDYENSFEEIDNISFEDLDSPTTNYKEFIDRVINYSIQNNSEELFSKKCKYTASIFKKVNYIYNNNLLVVNNDLVEETYKHINDPYLQSPDNVLDYMHRIYNSELSNNKILNNNKLLATRRKVINTYKLKQNNQHVLSKNKAIEYLRNKSLYKVNYLYDDFDTTITKHSKNEDVNEEIKKDNLYKNIVNYSTDIHKKKLIEILEKLVILKYLYSKDFDFLINNKINPFKNKLFFNNHFSNFSNDEIFELYNEIDIRYKDDIYYKYFLHNLKLIDKNNLSARIRFAGVDGSDKISFLEKTPVEIIPDYAKKQKYLEYANILTLSKAVLNLEQREQRGENVNYLKNHLMDYLEGNVNKYNKQTFRSLIAEANGELQLLKLPAEHYRRYLPLMAESYKNEVINHIGKNPEELLKKALIKVYNQSIEIDETEIKEGKEPPMLLKSISSISSINSNNNYNSKSKLNNLQKDLKENSYFKELIDLPRIALKKEFANKANRILNKSNQLMAIEKIIELNKNNPNNNIKNVNDKNNNTNFNNSLSELKSQIESLKKRKEKRDNNYKNIDVNEIKNKEKKLFVKRIKDIDKNSESNFLLDNSLYEQDMLSVDAVTNLDDNTSTGHSFNQDTLGDDYEEPGILMSSKGSFFKGQNSSDIYNKNTMILKSKNAVGENPFTDAEYVKKISKLSIEELKELGFTDVVDTKLTTDKFGGIMFKGKSNVSYGLCDEDIQDIFGNEKIKDTQDENQLTTTVDRFNSALAGISKNDYRINPGESSFDTPKEKEMRQNLKYLTLINSIENKKRLKQIEAALESGQSLPNYDPYYYELLYTNKKHLLTREEYLKRYFRNEDNSDDKVYSKLYEDLEEGYKLKMESDYYKEMNYKVSSKFGKEALDLYNYYCQYQPNSKEMDILEHKEKFDIDELTESINSFDNEQDKHMLAKEHDMKLIQGKLIINNNSNEDEVFDDVNLSTKNKQININKISIDNTEHINNNKEINKDIIFKEKKKKLNTKITIEEKELWNAKIFEKPGSNKPKRKKLH